MSRATDSGTPFTATMSSTEAARRRFMEPKWRMMARRRFGPTPSTSSRIDTDCAFVRSSRWNVIAKRWDSSRTCLMR